MSTERLSTVDPYEANGLLFRCWIIDEERFEWRTDDGHCRVGQNAGNAMRWGAIGQRVVGQHYVTLKAAMEAVAKAYERANRAA